MVYLNEEEINTAYTESSDEADQWRIDYPQYERLADNGLLDDLDENLPEVNDGSLAASLFKLAKRVIKKNMTGQAVALDRDDKWITELANIYWTKKILPNAKSKASPRRKWKDAVRKAAIFGGQPIITLFVERGNYTGADFIVPYAQDVKLEAGKDSDEDCDVIFWDVYYSKLQVRNMIEQAKEEMSDAGTPYVPKADPTADDDTEKPATKTAKAKPPVDAEGAKQDDDTNELEPAYNQWDVEALEAIVNGSPEEQRPGNQQAKAEEDKGHKKTGFHFFIAFQRGVDSPFTMIHAATKKAVRTWANPDPTGDVPVHYLYCYQDFINPYGIGIVKLAGGTQNVLDYMRQADVLATQLGLRPPKQIQGDEDQVDEDSLIYAQDANWYVGNAKVERMEMANGVYEQLPGRINMYQTSLQKMIPMGDTSISGSDSGDAQVSKTPAGVKLAAANLSIDDEDFSDNVDETYAAVTKSMINTEFANMQGTDLLKLSEDERDSLMKAGLEFPQDASGNMSQELNIIWDNSRATFDYEIDSDAQPPDDDQAALEGKLKVYELTQSDPTLEVDLASVNKKLDKGELLSEIFSTLTDNDKIIVDITEEEAQQIQQTAAQKAQDEADANSKPAQAPKSLGESVAWKPGDLREGERAQALAQVQIKADPATPQTAAPNEQQQNHDQSMDVLKAVQTPAPGSQPGETGAKPQPGATPAPKTTTAAQDKQHEAAAGHIKEVMSLYKVDANTAAAMLEAERQGYKPQEILDALKRNSGGGGTEPANQAITEVANA